MIVDRTLVAFGRVGALLDIPGAAPQVDVCELADEQLERGLALRQHGAQRLTIVAWPPLKAAKGVSRQYPAIRRYPRNT